MSLLSYKSKKLPNAIKKQMVERAVNKITVRDYFAAAYKKTQASPEEPLSEEREVSDTIIDKQANVPDELKNPKEHGGETEVLVSRLRESREEI